MKGRPGATLLPVLGLMLGTLAGCVRQVHYAPLPPGTVPAPDA